MYSWNEETKRKTVFCIHVAQAKSWQREWTVFLDEVVDENEHLAYRTSYMKTNLMDPDSSGRIERFSSVEEAIRNVEDFILDCVDDCDDLLVENETIALCVKWGLVNDKQMPLHTYRLLKSRTDLGDDFIQTEYSVYHLFGESESGETFCEKHGLNVTQFGSAECAVEMFVAKCRENA